MMDTLPKLSPAQNLLLRTAARRADGRVMPPDTLSGVIVHSDRGSQHCSREHRALLARNGLIASMSAKGNCYDNAAMESWNHSLKVEVIHGERFATRAQAKAQVFEYIGVDYNRNRLHSTMGSLSPEQFEQANAA